jgi:hypothetical protein
VANTPAYYGKELSTIITFLKVMTLKGILVGN